MKILQTPLFRVRNKKETIYCYSDEERKAAIAKLRQSLKLHALKVWAKFRLMSLNILSAKTFA
ncbi:MAG: hypothetical protein QM820_07555 [Minicystis sp.]